MFLMSSGFVSSNFKKVVPNRLSTLSFLAAVFFLFSFIPSSSASEGAKRILSLVDYIGGDYANAVQNGNIINEEEYSEMLDFSREALTLFEELKSVDGDEASMGPRLAELRGKIEKKSPVGDVEAISKDIKKALISTYNLVTYPKSHPSFQAGKESYEVNCVQCHGIAGAGDGPLAPNLTPPPTSFTDSGSVGGLSPFKVYNTMSFGIEGTAMPSFPNLSEQEKWNIAFYVLSLNFDQTASREGKRMLDETRVPQYFRNLKDLATLSNQEIVNEISPYLKDNDAWNAVAFLRRGTIETELEEENPLAVTRSLLRESETFYHEGNSTDAYAKTLDAYLEGFEKVESKLALKDSKLTHEIETKFTELRGAIKAPGNTEEVKATYAELNNDLNRAAVVLENGQPIGKAFSFINSFSIIVREGLEAVLIVAAVIAFLAATGAGDAIKYVHLGWVLALVAGLVTWFLAQTVISISGAEREIIEGATSLIAAMVLFYVSYWLITKIEVKKWKEYIQGKVKMALTKKNVLALASVSFFAVYREAFETVLFYQALWLQAENSQDAVIWGIAVGTILLLGIVLVVFKLGLRIPLKYFFSITSTLLYLLSFVLAGKGIRAFQEAGVLGITPLHYVPQIDALGIFPTLETTIPQAVLILAFIGAILWTGFVRREREKKEIAVSVSRIADDMKSMHEAFEHIKGHIVEWKRCEEIDLEAEELDRQIQDMIKYVDDLDNKLGDFFDVVSKSKEKEDEPQVGDKKPLIN